VVVRDKPNVSPDLFAMKWLPALEEFDLGGLGQTSGQFSKEQIERSRCESSGDPSAAVDMSCNDEELGQDFNPDNEIAIAVDPNDPDHLLAGSNDYYYRFNNAHGTRQAIVPTGFFTSFDGGATWIDGQMPRTASRSWRSWKTHEAMVGVISCMQMSRSAARPTAA
jgi:hypothetical protein